MLSRSLGAISRRAASASTATRVTTESVTKLPSGLTVASIEQHGAASQLVVAYRAGSRYESEDNQGVAHVLRNTIGNDSASYPGLQLVWNSAQKGADIKSSVSRDVLAVQVSCPRNDAQTVLSILGELANPACKPWNIEDTYETLSSDSAYKCPVSRTIDGLHEAAFRNGPLGHNSLLKNSAPGWKKVLEFKEKHISSSNAVVIGVNIDHDILVQGANSFRLSEGSAAVLEKSKYFGGEKRMLVDPSFTFEVFSDEQGPITFVALAGEGVSLASVNEVAAQTVASEILLAVAKKSGAEVSPINISYTDSGLVGVTFSASHDAVNQLVKNVAGAFKTAKADDASVSVAKSKAALKVLTAAETASSVAFDQAVQFLATGNTVSPSEFAQAINNVSSADVQKVLSRVSAKPCLSSVGRTANVPYLDEL